MDDLKVNDGGGLFDAAGLIDTLIEDCNELPKDLISGHFIRASSRLVQMVQKLATLKQGIKTDADSMKEQIEEMRRLNGELAEATYGIPADKGDEADELER